MSSEFENLYYGISKNGYVLINCNDIDFANDTIIMEIMKKQKKVVFGDKFYKPVNNLPNGITHLQFGRSFNQSLDNLPRTLKELIIAPQEISWCKFNQPLDNLPIGLECLVLKLIENYNYNLDNLPYSLKELHLIVKRFNQPLNNLPDGLEKLTVSKFNFYGTYSLPSSLKEVIITFKIIPEEKEMIVNNLISKYPNIQFNLNDN